MSKGFLTFGVSLLLAAQAQAADKLVIAPPADWVKPVATPAAPAISGAAPTRILLQDQQADLRAGRQTIYSRTVLRIETAQGLSAGSVTFSWDPAIDAPTVHSLSIRRGDKTIDVLANQSFTVVRRESNLEKAVLDGVLTATVQPEGLQVGDVVDYSMSISHSDPALGAHAEMTMGGWNGLPVLHGHLRAQWPSATPMHLRTTPGLPAPVPVKHGATTSVELSLDDVQPLQPPKAAPPRYAVSRVWELTDFARSDDLARLAGPLFARAAILPPQGALQGEIAKIAAQSTDPKVRAQAALTLVQDRVRYVFLGINDGGLIPADAETTWSRRFGDCKGKTVLLLALLHGLGVEAEPVLVNATAGDGIDERLPMVGLFNHVLVRTTLGGKTYWLDGTRTGDTDLDQIRVPFFRWGLPLVPGGALVAMVPPPLDRPLAMTRVRIDASAGISAPAPFHVETVWRDDLALAMSLGLAQQAPDVRDSGLRAFWRKQYDFVDVKTVGASYDPARREEHLTMDGVAHMDWTDGWYETDGLGVGYRADFTRDPGAQQAVPFAIDYPSDARTEETILLPETTAFRIDHPEPIDATVAGVVYHRQVGIVGSRFTGIASERSLVPEFAASDAPAAQKALRDLNEKTVHLHSIGNYVPTPQEADTAMLTKPDDAEGFVDRGTIMMANDRLDEAIADFTSALAADPRNARALAARGYARAKKGDFAAARVDLDAAAAINPKDPSIEDGRALLAAQKGHPQAAADAFTKALALAPGDDYALSQRARAYRDAGDLERALADASAVLARYPQDGSLRLLRADIYRGLGKRDLAAADAAAMSAGTSTSDFAQVSAGLIYAAIGDQTNAMKAFDRAIAIAPSPFAYINRSRARPWRDFAGRQTDIDAALKAEPGAKTDMTTIYRADPHAASALLAQAELQEDRHDHAAAVATLEKLLAAQPVNYDAILALAVARARLGDEAGARAALGKLDALKDSAAALGRVCRSLAEAGVMIATATVACDAALNKAPDDLTISENRALALLRAGQTAQAITVYTQLLAKRSSWASARYGRALAERKSGQIAAATVDRAEAMRIDPGIADHFERLGLPS
jgi:tetratricopeptide (TPR) repeat protein